MKRPARKRNTSSKSNWHDQHAGAYDEPPTPSGQQPTGSPGSAPVRATPGSAGVPPASAGGYDAPLPPTSDAFKQAQDMFATAIMRPMTMNQEMQRTWIDGRSMQQVAAEFIKPNDRLTSLERLEIYNCQYWFRLVDCMYDDFPGLLAAIGQKKFDALITEYLVRHPSSSYTLRNLGSRLIDFIEANQHMVAPISRLALDMARIEWAWIVAFDGEARRPVRQEDIRGQDPENLRLALQPHITLLDLDYPLDDFLISLKKVEHLKTEAAAGSSHRPGRCSRIPLPKPERALIAVHRCDNVVYYKRLEPEEYAILKGIDSGQSIAEACALPLTDRSESPPDVQALSDKITTWFATWSELGWLCLP